jgi:hypothetical protein
MRPIIACLLILSAGLLEASDTLPLPPKVWSDWQIFISNRNPSNRVNYRYLYWRDVMATHYQAQVYNQGLSDARVEFLWPNGETASETKVIAPGTSDTFLWDGPLTERLDMNISVLFVR